MELLKQIAPSVTGGVIRDSADPPPETSQWGAIQTAAPSSGVDIEPDQRSRRPGGIEGAIAP